MRGIWLWAALVAVTMEGGNMSLAQDIHAEAGYRPLDARTVRIWDANTEYTEKFYGFTETAWPDRAKWRQVPYGVTEYAFVGDAILEGENFWIFLHSSRFDSVFLYAKVDEEGTPSRHNEIYRSYDTDALSPNGTYGWNEHPGRMRCFGGGSAYAKIEKNEPDEFLVESAALPGTKPGFPEGYSVNVTTAYRALGGRHWVEIRPVRQASEQGMHGESRILVVPDGSREGTDFVTDADKEQAGTMDTGAHGVWLPDNSKMLLDLIMDADLIWMMTWPDPFKARPYGINCYGGYQSGWQRIGEGTCPKIFSSPFARFGNGTEPVIIGVLYKNYWHYQRLDEQVQEGQVLAGTWKRAYTRGLPHGTYPVDSPWTPGYPGIWRTIGCIDGEYYTEEQAITGAPTSEFSFTCPAEGKLEYLITYLYERTEETPMEVSTPMDIYRESVTERQ
ncbi:MAG: hypothetical protein V1800_00015 [Candidatus Latescibacterota bacterium]